MKVTPTPIQISVLISNPMAVPQLTAQRYHPQAIIGVRERHAFITICSRVRSALTGGKVGIGNGILRCGPSADQ
jgi:hypothetical protein